MASQQVSSVGSSADEDLTLELATFLSRLTYEKLPLEVIQQAKACVLNCLGCAFGSVLGSSSQKAFNTLVPQEPNIVKEVTIIGRAECTSIDNAAFLNGIAITTADYDDTHLRTVIHPSGTPLAAILPWAEKHQLSGKDVILALVCGIEAQCSVGNVISPSHYRNGWHVTGTTGSFGAAASMAKLLNLSPKQFADALGHASSMAAGTRAMFGADTKTIHMGRGAQNGILAARLAQQDFSSNPRSIEYWAKLVSEAPDNLQLATLPRNGEWQIMQNAFKPYPCGIVIHPLIDGCLEAFEILSKKMSGTRSVVQIIDKIDVTVTPQCVRLCSIRHPRTALETIFSLYHGCAVALVHGKAGPAEFSDLVAANDPEVAAVRDLIQVKTQEGLRDDEAHLVFTFKSDSDYGPDLVLHVEHAIGSLAKPLSQDQLEQKYLDQAVPRIGSSQAGEIIEQCWNLENLKDISDLMKLCRPSSAVSLELSGMLDLPR